MSLILDPRDPLKDCASRARCLHWRSYVLECVHSIFIIYQMRKTNFFQLCLLLILTSPSLHAQQASSNAAPAFHGDIGVGIHHAPNIVNSVSNSDQTIPYANFEYGDLFVRIDMIGLRTIPIGYGNIELVTRVLDDGYTRVGANGEQERRRSSVPLGLGTLQIMPFGAIMVNVYRDANQSHGTMADVLFAEEIDLGDFSIYPQIGAEYRSGDYVRYFYGVSRTAPTQSMAGDYIAMDATNPFIALFIEMKITGNWYLNTDIRKLWLDKSIYSSPIVKRHNITTGLVALSYRF